MNYAQFLKPRYEPGEVINSGRPYAHVLLDASRGRYCDCCVRPAPQRGSVGGLVACEGCGWDSYCGDKCRSEAERSYHRYECALLAAWVRAGKAPERLAYMTRLLLRAVVRRVFEGVPGERPSAAAAEAEAAGDRPVFASLDDPGWRPTFDDLFSNEDNLRRRPDLYEPALAAFDELWSGGGVAPPFELPSRDKLLGIYGRLRTNCCELYDPELRNIGRAVYLSPCVGNHSCSPNSLFVNHGLLLEWRAARAIDTTQEQIFFHYVDEFVLATTAERQELCRTEYLFECRCPFCDGSEEALRRDRRLTSLRCAHGDDCRKIADCEHCNRAGSEANTDERAAAESEARSVIEAARAAEARGDHAAAAELAARYLDGEQPLGVCNVLVVRVREALVRACLELSRPALGGTLAEECSATAAERWRRRGAAEGAVLLDVYELLYFRPAWPIGKLRAHVGDLLFRDGRAADAAQQYEAALDILRVTHGAEHDLVLSIERRLSEAHVFSAPAGLDGSSGGRGGSVAQSGSEHVARAVVVGS